MYDMDKGYWDNKPMKQQLESIALSGVNFQSGEVNLDDLEGLIKAGVRFPEIEELMNMDPRMIDLCSQPY